MELEAEEQNKTPIIKIGERSWSTTSRKPGSLPSLLFSFYTYLRIVSYVPHIVLGTHTSMNEQLSQICSYQVIKFYHTRKPEEITTIH